MKLKITIIEQEKRRKMKNYQNKGFSKRYFNQLIAKMKCRKGIGEASDEEIN